MARLWPKYRLILGGRRWIIVGKNPSRFEKWWGDRFGVILVCFVVIEASSRAISRPATVTMRAANLIDNGMVRIDVLVGRMFWVIRRPAIMLPHASRLIGLITAGLFSLIGLNEGNRGWPITTKKVRRRL